jgi:hypothetical protein
MSRNSFSSRAGDDRAGWRLPAQSQVILGLQPFNSLLGWIERTAAKGSKPVSRKRMVQEIIP